MYASVFVFLCMCVHMHACMYVSACEYIASACLRVSVCVGVYVWVSCLLACLLPPEGRPLRREHCPLPSRATELVTPQVRVCCRSGCRYETPGLKGYSLVNCAAASSNKTRVCVCCVCARGCGCVCVCVIVCVCVTPVTKGFPVKQGAGALPGGRWPTKTPPGRGANVAAVRYANGIQAKP